MEGIFLVVGLGNPGAKYEGTRHNVGFGTIDILSSKYGISVSKLKHKALIGDGEIKGCKVILAKPQTFMNLSGESVRELIRWYKIPLKNVIVIYDDIDIPVGKLRIRPGGSSGTHNGMKSIIYLLEKDDFPRIRIGVGKPPQGWDLADYVLGRFTEDERKPIYESILKAAEAATAIIEEGTNAAMNKFNG